MIKIAPSILSADFSILGKEVDDCKKGGADYIHFDVMDGEFVPNISFGIPVLKSLRAYTDAFLDVHLMIDRPVRYVKEFCESGADLVTVHVEADEFDKIKESIRIIHECNKLAGISVKPGTGIETIASLLNDIDLVLVMTVEPGFGGQKFMGDMMDKITWLRNFEANNDLDFDVEVDGGINEDTAKIAIKAGANVLVAGSSVFKYDDRAEAISKLRP